MVKNVSAPVIRLIEDDTIVNCNSTNAATLVYLPVTSTKDITIKKTDSSANAVTITTSCGKTLEGAVRQVETATAAGTVTAGGDAAVVVTSALLPNGAITYAVPIVAGSASDTAAAIRAYLGTQEAITQNFTISGSTTAIVLTTIDYLPADSTLNISLATGTATGVTTAGTSANTTAASPIQLATENEYCTLRKSGGSWIVIDTGGVNKTETLANKTLTNPAPSFTINTHDYASGHVDWTLSTAEKLLTYHKVVSADAGVNAIIALTTSRPYTFINASGQTLTVKGASGNGIAIANNKTATVMSDGTHIVRLTGDA